MIHSKYMELKNSRSRTMHIYIYNLLYYVTGDFRTLIPYLASIFFLDSESSQNNSETLYFLYNY